MPSKLGIRCIPRYTTLRNVNTEWNRNITGLLGQKASSRLDCMRVCDTACLKTWSCLRQDMHECLNELLGTRLAHLRECFPESAFGGSSVLKTRISKINTSWRKSERKFHLPKMAHHTGHQGLILEWVWAGNMSVIVLKPMESCRSAASPATSLLYANDHWSVCW